MTLATHHETILLQLAMYALLTEHELAAATAKKLNQQVADVQPRIGAWLMELRTGGLVWAGQLFIEAKPRQFMWAACLTSKGKELVNTL